MTAYGVLYLSRAWVKAFKVRIYEGSIKRPIHQSQHQCERHRSGTVTTGVTRTNEIYYRRHVPSSNLSYIRYNGQRCSYSCMIWGGSHSRVKHTRSTSQARQLLTSFILSTPIGFALSWMGWCKGSWEKLCLVQILSVLGDDVFRRHA